MCVMSRGCVDVRAWRRTLSNAWKSPIKTPPESRAVEGPAGIFWRDSETTDRDVAKRWMF